MNNTLEYEEHFTAFIDFLGFGEASEEADDLKRSKILALLLSLSSLRGEFNLTSTQQENGKTSHMRPAISTFSDHIVISFPLKSIQHDLDSNDFLVGITIMNQFNDLLTRIAAAALQISFLIRGGATIGKLYHAKNVVFGEAMVNAFRIESMISIYPRVVLSPQITRRHLWMEKSMNVLKADDGLYHFNYFDSLVLKSATPGDNYSRDINIWFNNAIKIINTNLTNHEATGRLDKFAKWVWFAREFRRGLERLNPELLKAFGVSLDAINSWPV